MAAQMHGRPFRAVKELVQPLAALDSFLPYGKKILIWHHFPAITIRDYRDNNVPPSANCVPLSQKYTHL